MPVARCSSVFGSFIGMLALGLPAAGDKSASQKLDGKWVYESQTIGGSELSQESRDEIWVEIKDDVYFRRGKSGLRQELRLSLNFTREPPEFTIVFKHPVTNKLSERKGILRLDGDRLTLCYDNSGRTRPTKFESPEGRDEIVLSKLKRTKK
jgi:uncharacterized protein (TIGR03067 family)